jgi:nicotinate-nucleotide pyrophosphorylase (carboxylating)
MADFQQIEWDEQLDDDCRQLVRLAIREDLGRAYDWTTVSLVPDDARGTAAIVARKPGVIAGLPALRAALLEFDPRVQLTESVADSATVAAGQQVAMLSGSARSLLTSERLLLNLLGRLSGIATLTRQYVDRVAGTKARIYDTRKTMPGWRRMEKYAVRQGGGHNHRLGLFDGVLIKDNHLAFGAPPDADIGSAARESREESNGAQTPRVESLARFTPAEAVLRARQFLEEFQPAGKNAQRMLIEIEVDTLEQLDGVLPALPDIVLLDNMPPHKLREAVRRRDATFPQVELEASGGVNLHTVAEIACTGVDRISVGALTHSAEWFDVGLDWSQP